MDLSGKQNDIKNQQAVCPECDTPLILPKDLLVGTIIECPACATESECISLNPLTFSPIEEEK